MSIWAKIPGYLSILYDEFSYRAVYVWAALVGTFINVFIFWNEILIFILSPLENIILKNNRVVLHEVLLKHYNVEDVRSSVFIDGTSLTSSSNEIPYYEINISEFESIDNIMILVYLLVIIAITLPYTYYQYMLFITPVLLKHELFYAVHRIFIFGVLTSLFTIITYYVSIPIIVSSLLIATEEIGLYEFEVEFNIESYLILILRMILFQICLAVYIVNFKKESPLRPLLLVATVYSFLWLQTTTVLFIYCSISVLSSYGARCIFLYLCLSKYRYCFSLGRNTKDEMISP